MSRSKMLGLPIALFILVSAAACAPAVAVQPTADTAMMAKETESAAMMMKETDTAMMAKETENAAMMMKETDTAMMAKETESAAMMMKETDTAMMAKETETAMMSETPDAMAAGDGDAMMALPPQQFAAHFVDSMPMHEATLTEVPELVLLNFNFTLSDASTITIDKDGKEIKTGAGELGDKKLSMTSTVPQDMGAGVYVVKYKACWPDNSCHDGQFAFTVKQ